MTRDTGQARSPGHGDGPATYETWDEDRTPFRHVPRLDAASYRPDVLFDVAPSLWEEGDPYVPSPDGGLTSQNRLLPAGTPLRLYGKQEGKGY
jgi:hypothetical protein